MARSRPVGSPEPFSLDFPTIMMICLIGIMVLIFVYPHTFIILSVLFIILLTSIFIYIGYKNSVSKESMQKGRELGHMKKMIYSADSIPVGSEDRGDRFLLPSYQSEPTLRALDSHVYLENEDFIIEWHRCDHWFEEKYVIALKSPEIPYIESSYSSIQRSYWVDFKKSVPGIPKNELNRYANRVKNYLMMARKKGIRITYIGSITDMTRLTIPASYRFDLLDLYWIAVDIEPVLKLEGFKRKLKD